MAKLIKPEDLGKHISKLQGDKSDVAYAAELQIARPSLRALKAGKYEPRTTILRKLGLERLYRPLAIETPVPATKKAAAKK